MSTESRGRRPLTGGAAALARVPQRSRQEPLAARLRGTLLRTSRRLRDQRVGDLTDAQMAALAQTLRHGPVTPGDLAEREHVRPPSMTRTLAQLRQAGLVTMARNPGDKRQQLVEITPAGHDRILQTRRRRDEWLQRRLAALTAAERATLSDAEAILAKLLLT